MELTPASCIPCVFRGRHTCAMRCRPALASIRDIRSVKNVLETSRHPCRKTNRDSLDSSLGTHLQAQPQFMQHRVLVRHCWSKKIQCLMTKALHVTRVRQQVSLN